MTEYISREDALAVFGDVHPMDYNANAYIEKIKAIPKADVVECEYGEWEWHPYSSDWACVCCDYHSMEHTNFCPNCGADMRQDPLAEKPCDDCSQDKCTIAETGSCDEARMDVE